MTAFAGGRWLLPEAWAVAVAVRGMLWILPFSRVLRIVEDLRRRPSRRAPVPPERVAVAVRRAGRLVPGCSCLTRALAGHVLLSRAGHGSRLRIGLRQVVDGALQAHAWVECDGQVILGADEREGFVPLPALEKR